MLKITVTVLLTLLPGVLCQQEGCTNLAVDACMVNVVDFYEALFLHETSTSSWNRAYMDQMCSANDEAIECMSSFIDECDPLTAELISGFGKGATFICANKDSFLASQTCVNQEQVHSKLEACLQEVDDAISTLNINGLCSKILEALECVKTTLQGNCDEDAIAIVEVYEYQKASPFAEALQCGLDMPEFPDDIIIPEGLSQPTGPTCDTTVSNRCLGSLREFYQEFSTDSFQFQSKDTLRQECDANHEVLPCVQDVTSSVEECSSVDQVVYQGIEAEIVYLCDDGFDAYIDNQACLVRDDVEQSIRNCQLPEHAYDFAETIQQLCQLNEFDLECIKQEVTRACGTRAGSLQYNRKLEKSTPLRDFIGCKSLARASTDTSKGSSLATGVIIAIVVAIVGLVLLLVAVLFMIWKLRKPQPSPPQEPPVQYAHRDQSGGIANPMFGTAPPGVGAVGGDGQGAPPAYVEKEPLPPSDGNEYVEPVVRPMSDLTEKEV